MFAPTRYIAWAMKFYGQVPFDLASSGIPLVAFRDLGVPPPDVDDPGAYAAFTRGIARYHDLAESDVVPTVGTTQAIFLAYASMTSPGDEILVEAPGYEPLTRTAEGLGLTVRSYERRATEGFALVPERVAAAMTPRTRVIVVTTLHNPTGVRADGSALREIATIAAAQGAYLLVDEVYAPFDDLPEDGVFRRSARKIAANVVAIGSLTKCYGLGMYRVGWLLGPPEVVAAAKEASISTFGHLPLTHAAYGAVALSAVGPLAKRAKSLLGTKRAAAEAWLLAHPRLGWSAPPAGLFGLVTVPGEGDLRPRIEEVAAREGVLVGAGSFFGMPRSFRLSWATTSPEDFATGLTKLATLVA